MCSIPGRSIAPQRVAFPLIILVIARLFNIILDPDARHSEPKPNGGEESRAPIASVGLCRQWLGH